MCRQDSDSQSQTGVRFVVTERSKPPEAMLSMHGLHAGKSCYLQYKSRNVRSSAFFWILCFIPFCAHHLFSFSSAFSSSSPSPLLSPSFCFSSRCASWWGFPWISRPWMQHPERESPVSPQTWIMTCVPLLWTFPEFFCLFPTPLNLGVWPGWGLGPPWSPFSSSCHFLSVPSATVSLSYAEFSPPTTSKLSSLHSDL